MDLQEIKKTIKQAAEAIQANEKLPLPILAAKARREAEARPQDVALANASQVLTKMASTQTFISKPDFEEIINRFHASHSKLADVFSAEIGKRAERKPAVFSRDAHEGISLGEEFNRFADPVLSNALAAAMEANPQERLYSQADAQRAQRAAQAQLIGIGVSPKEIKTFAGRNDTIICQATHETPRGVAQALIPVTLKEGKALMPDLFFGREGFSEMTKGQYVRHLMSVAGKSFRVDGAKLLDIIERVKKGEDKGPDVVEWAAIKLASKEGSYALEPSASLYGTMEQPQEDVQVPRLENEESKFADTLSKPDGVARFIHGDRVVEAGRSMIVRKFAEMGFGRVQVRVADIDEQKISFAVAIGTGTGLKVPVEIQGNMVMPPKIVFADDMVTAFTKDSIAEVVKSASGGNRRALAQASECSDMKPGQLLDIAKKAVDDGMYRRAEEAINVLGEVDPATQRIAVAYMMGNIYEPGQNPGDEIAAMQKAASKPVEPTPQFMAHKIFFPEGA